MKTINIQQAKTHLSRLVEAACAGEEILVAKAGRPMVRLLPIGTSFTERKPGGWKGKVKISVDFDAEDDRINALFEGRAKGKKK